MKTRLIESPECCRVCKHTTQKEAESIYVRKNKKHGILKDSKVKIIYPCCALRVFDLRGHVEGKGRGSITQIFERSHVIKSFYLDNHCEKFQLKEELLSFFLILNNHTEQIKNIYQTLTINNLIQPKEDFNVTN
jgi:hypothetical protein